MPYPNLLEVGKYIPVFKPEDLARLGISLTREQVEWCMRNPPNLLFGTAPMHDHDGKPLKVGDIVNVPCQITHVSAGDYCTLNARTIYPMPGNGTCNELSLNTKQVHYVGPASIIKVPDANKPPPGVDADVEAKLAKSRQETDATPRPAGTG